MNGYNFIHIVYRKGSIFNPQAASQTGDGKQPSREALLAAQRVRQWALDAFPTLQHKNIVSPEMSASFVNTGRTDISKGCLTPNAPNPKSTLLSDGNELLMGASVCYCDEDPFAFFGESQMSSHKSGPVSTMNNPLDETSTT